MDRVITTTSRSWTRASIKIIIMHWVDPTNNLFFFFFRDHDVDLAQDHRSSPVAAACSHICYLARTLVYFWRRWWRSGPQRRIYIKPQGQYMVDGRNDRRETWATRIPQWNIGRGQTCYLWWKWWPDVFWRYTFAWSWLVQFDMRAYDFLSECLSIAK